MKQMPLRYTLQLATVAGSPNCLLTLRQQLSFIITIVMIKNIVAMSPCQPKVAPQGYVFQEK